MKTIGFAMLVAACACLVPFAPASATENAPLPGSIAQTGLEYVSGLDDGGTAVAGGGCGVDDTSCTGTVRGGSANALPAINVMQTAVNVIRPDSFVTTVIGVPLAWWQLLERETSRSSGALTGLVC